MLDSLRRPRRVRPVAALACALALAGATRAETPVPPSAAVVAPLPSAAGPLGAARAGVAAAIVAQIADVPTLLAEPGVQPFLDDAFARLEALAPEEAARERWRALRGRLRSSDAHAERAATASGLAAATLELLHALPAPRDRLFLLGFAAQQTEYNARVLREATSDAQLRQAVGGIDAADAAIGGLASLRRELAALPAERFAEAARLGNAVVTALLGAPSRAFPAAPRIWTIVVRARAVPGRESPHLAVDVVWFDGHHDTYAAYPDGDAYDRNVDHMRCTRDREPVSGILHATPLVPPAGRTFDGLAADVERACAALSAQAPPYFVSQDSDRRFVAAVLTYAGIDPHVLAGPKPAK